MKTQHRKRELSNSKKYFNTLRLSIQNEQAPQRSQTEMQKKIEMLKTPAYQRKKVLKRTSQNLLLGKNTKLKNKDSRKSGKIIEGLKTDDNESTSKSQKRYGSGHSRKSFHSWFRKSTRDLSQRKNKNLVDILIAQKEIHRDSIPVYQRRCSTSHFRDRHSQFIIPNQDSQSLLRKNSLYLLNFIKRQENKNRQTSPHIGGIPNLAAHMRIEYQESKSAKLTPKNGSRKKMERIEKMVPTLSKILCNMPIAPWE